MCCLLIAVLVLGVDSAGDVIIQNGANSMVGQAVVQMAREMGVRTINVVREGRPNLPGIIRTLQGMGGDAVITDAFLNTKARMLSRCVPC